MNPYLKTRHDAYTALRAELAGLQTRAVAEKRDLTPDELKVVEEKGAELRKLADEIRPMLEEEERHRAVSALAAKVEQDTGRASAERGPALLPSLLPSGEALAEMHRTATEGKTSGRWEVDEQVHTRATVTLTNTGTVQGELPVRPLVEPRRIAIAGRVPVVPGQGVAGAVYPIFGDADAADIVAEGATKPEYDAITTGTAVPQVIALWTDFTRQVDLTMTSFQTRLRAKLAARVARREDQLMVARVLGTTGIQTYAAAADEPYPDALLGAAALVMSSDVASNPNLAIVHPSDVTKVFGAQAIGQLGQSPDAELLLDLHGMTVYPSTAVAAGTAVVGAWSVAAEAVVGMPPTFFIDPVSGLKTNKITVLLEEAVTLAVTEPSGFVSVDFVP